MVEITSDPGMDSNYATGEDIEVTATFDQAVTVTDKPRIELRLGGGNRGRRWAEYASGSGTTALVFSYTVVATDESDTTASRWETLHFRQKTWTSTAGRSRWPRPGRTPP